MYRDFPTVVWLILFFDKTSANPLPLKNRPFALDWSLLDPQQAELVRSVHCPTPAKSSIASHDATIVSMQRTSSRPDNRMLSVRNCFSELSDDQWRELAQKGPVEFVELNREYIEDDSGKEITMYEIIQHISGITDPIISGDADSVLRIDPCPPSKATVWTVENANKVGQFVNVIELIVASKWYRRPNRLTFNFKGGSSTKFDTLGSTILEALSPDHNDVLQVLALFRQLHGKDKLIVEVCDIFISNCTDDRKNAWIKDMKDSYTAMIDSPSYWFGIPDSRRKIIRMFMYAAGLLHSHANDTLERERFTELITTYGKERIVALFNYCLWDILSVAIPIFAVIKREVEYWIKECGLVGQTRIDISELFEGISGSDKTD